MSRKYSVVHISQTPLVGAPGKIAKALQLSGIRSSCFCVNDYPNKGPLYKNFIDNTLPLSAFDKQLWDFFDYEIAKADILHIHNDIDLMILNRILPLCESKKIVYQVHSPLREGPLFVDRTDALEVDFAKKLVVAQYQPRHYPDYECVPNIVLDMPSYIPRREQDILKVVFSPTHSRHGRWNAKNSPNLEKTLTTLSDNGKISLFMPEKPVSPKELMLVRKYSDVTIDEIATGAYHQISLEGLCAGNVVINRSDYFSKRMLSLVADTISPPPFVYADDGNIFDVICELAENVSLTNDIKRKSYEFFMDNLRPELLVKRYVSIYDEVYEAN